LFCPQPAKSNSPAQAIFSFIVYGTSAALEIAAPQFYYRIGVLVGQILSVIFWLSAWAYSASFATSWTGWFAHSTLNGVYGGCAGLGAIVWSVHSFTSHKAGCQTYQDGD
jgi:hypothetical protein